MPVSVPVRMDRTSGQIHYVDHLDVAELAELLGVHESYVHRHMATSNDDPWPCTRWVRARVLFSPEDVTEILARTARRRGESHALRAVDDAESA